MAGILRRIALHISRTLEALKGRLKNLRQFMLFFRTSWLSLEGIAAYMQIVGVMLAVVAVFVATGVLTGKTKIRLEILPPIMTLDRARFQSIYDERGKALPNSLRAFAPVDATTSADVTKPQSRWGEEYALRRYREELGVQEEPEMQPSRAVAREIESKIEAENPADWAFQFFMLVAAAGDQPGLPQELSGYGIYEKAEEGELVARIEELPTAEEKIFAYQAYRDSRRMFSVLRMENLTGAEVRDVNLLIHDPSVRSFAASLPMAGAFIINDTSNLKIWIPRMSEGEKKHLIFWKDGNAFQLDAVQAVYPLLEGLTLRNTLSYVGAAFFLPFLFPFLWQAWTDFLKQRASSSSQNVLADKG